MRGGADARLFVEILQILYPAEVFVGFFEYFGCKIFAL